MVRDSNKRPSGKRRLFEGGIYFIFLTIWGGLYWREVFKRSGCSLEDLLYLKSMKEHFQVKLFNTWKLFCPHIFVHIVKGITPNTRSLDLLKNVGALWI